MKTTLMFGSQVFITLILFMAIFVTYLERKDVQPVENADRSEVHNSIGSTGSLVDKIATSFTTSFSGVISCGK